MAERRVSWWLRPSKLPKAPPTWVVCLFGAAWNATIERSLWATLFCLALIPAFQFLGWLDHKIFDT